MIRVADSAEVSHPGHRHPGLFFCLGMVMRTSARLDQNISFDAGGQHGRAYTAQSDRQNDYRCRGHHHALIGSPRPLSSPDMASHAKMPAKSTSARSPGDDCSNPARVRRKSTPFDAIAFAV